MGSVAGSTTLRPLPSPHLSEASMSTQSRREQTADSTAPSRESSEREPETQTGTPSRKPGQQSTTGTGSIKVSG